MSHIYFIRHGQSQLNVEHRVAGTTDTPLTAEGRRQAKAAGKAAKDIGIDYIISSPLSRAHDTAKLIAKEIGYPEDKIEVNPLFIERHFGSREAQPYQADFNYDGIVDAEQSTDFLARTRRAVDYLHSLPYKKILVVSHGATGRALRHHLIPDQPFHHPGRYANADMIRLK